MYFKAFLIASLLCVVFSHDILDPPYDLEDARAIFEAFKVQFDRHYSSELEEQQRFQLFKETLEFINKLNHDKPVFGVHNFGDMMDEQKQAYIMLDD